MDLWDRANNNGVPDFQVDRKIHHYFIYLSIYLPI